MFLFLSTRLCVTSTSCITCNHRITDSIKKLVFCYFVVMLLSIRGHLRNLKGSESEVVQGCLWLNSLKFHVSDEANGRLI